MLSFYNSFARIGINEVFAHLVDNYVKTGQTTWYDSTSVSEIKKRADVLTASFEGKIAPDLKFMNITTGDSISIHQVQAKYTILFFWSPGCGHCKNAAEKMRDFIADGKKDLKVFAVCTKEKSGGLTFISENKLENFINCIDEKNKSDYFSFYYVVSTPVAFLLDRNKRIIAKKAGDTGIMDMVKQLEEQKDKF
jgi:thiol-disulfide isomerase/thioredoxin